jgi:hypothetical protein
MSPRVSKNITAIALLFWPLMFMGSAQAEQSANELLRKYSAADASERQGIEEILRATENGMGWFSAAAKITLYCEPKKLALTGSQIIDILRAKSLKRQGSGRILRICGH